MKSLIIVQKRQTVFFAILLVLMTVATRAYAYNSYLDNGVVRIGVDTTKGGTITYFASHEDPSFRDVVNDYDMGRMIQQSYYAGPVPFEGANWMGDDWPWNPVAAGDKDNYISTVLEHTNDGQTIYIKRIPKQWGLSNVDSECTTEEWIELKDNVAIVRCRLINNRSDTTFYPIRNQELPAVYTNNTFRYIYTYEGDVPFTNDSMSQIISPDPTPPWTYYYATENWTALVDSGEWGLGVYHPGVQITAAGYHNNPYSPAATGYVSPIRAEYIDYNIVYEYEYYLILDDLSDIRSYVYQHRPDPLPNFQFIKDRQGWYYYNTVDAGFPIDGYVRVDLNAGDPYMHSPLGMWDSSDTPKLYIRARYNSIYTSAQVFWREPQGSMSGAKSVTFTVIPDGQWHTYEVNLASDPDYTGMIWQYRFDPVPAGSAGHYVDIEYISAYPIPGDFDRDKNVDLFDFAVLTAHWLEKLPTEFIGDLDLDRDVDFADILVFCEYWLVSF